MPLYRKPEDRASETVTVRLTPAERNLIDYLSQVEEKTITDLVRSLIAKRAVELGIEEVPEPKPKKKPGRPKKKKQQEEKEETTIALTAEKEDVYEVTGGQAEDVDAYEADEVEIVYDVDVPIVVELPEEPEEEADAKTTTFEDLIQKFRAHFSHRAEGTQRELEETISFLCQSTSGPAVIPFDLPIKELTPDKLAQIRATIQESNLRLASKNRHLTYLRMMLHFAVKDPDIELEVNPAVDLEPLSLVESSNSWQFFRGGGGET